MRGRRQGEHEVGTESEAARTHEGPVLAFTRVSFRHWWLTPLALLRFHALYRNPATRSERGLLRGAVAVEDPWTLLNVSVWRDKHSLRLWSGNDHHVRQVRWTYVRTAEGWSALSVIREVSASARSWSGHFVPPTSDEPTQ